MNMKLSSQHNTSDDCSNGTNAINNRDDHAWETDEYGCDSKEDGGHVNDGDKHGVVDARWVTGECFVDGVSD